MPWHSTSLVPDQVPSDRGIRVVVAGTAVFVAGFDGRWYAVEDRCSHAGCAFSQDGAVVEGVLICDCHGSEFDLRSGDVLRPPAMTPIRSFAVRTVAGRVDIEVGP